MFFLKHAQYRFVRVRLPRLQALLQKRKIARFNSALCVCHEGIPVPRRTGGIGEFAQVASQPARLLACFLFKKAA